MGKLLAYFIGVAIAALVWGFWDAGKERRVSADVRARVINAWSLYFDSQEAFQPLENGQLFVEVTWSQPSISQRVSSIWINGSVTDDAQLVATVDAPCERAGSTWLGDGKWRYGSGVNERLVCFVKIGKVLKSPTGAEPIHMDEANAGIANMRISFTAKVAAVNKPMRYVTWVKEHAVSAYQTVSSPFQRE